VILFEKRDRLGGALHLCAAPPGREEFLELVRFHAQALADLNVDIRLETEASLEAITACEPDQVVCAYGAQPILPPFATEAKMEYVFLADQVLRGEKVCFGDTAIVGGGAVGCETALFLAHQGRMPADVAAFLIQTNAETPERVAELLVQKLREVHLIEILAKVGEDIGKSTRWTMMLDLKRSKVNMHRETRVLSIEKDGVLVEKEKDEKLLIPCDNVVIATGFQTDDTLAKSLESAGLNVKIIGDACSPRRAIDAIVEGFMSGWEL